MGVGKRFSARVTAGGDPAPTLLDALATAENFAHEAGLDARGCARLAVVVEELVSNAIRHGAQDGAIAIDLSISATPKGIALALDDDGAAFDPINDRVYRGPDPETGGGVGLALVRAWAESLVYARENGRNRIEVLLRLG